MFYTRLTVSCNEDYRDILTAELADIGFDTFMETDAGLEAFVENENFDASRLEEIRKKYSTQTTLQFSTDRVEKENWNEQWEKSYEPIDVEGKCLIRAEFHAPDKKFPYEIVITPKMSFGTGHHQTTYLMVKNQMTIDHRNKRVMDAGCGTAILSIMACKLGANKVEAFDIDEWSVINGEENISINACTNIHLQQGKISEVKLAGLFDIILANINKNVLLSEMEIYSTFLNDGGLLLLSGFYTSDISDLKECAEQFKLREVQRDNRESWACLLLKKN
jgi:ribosomal protein L11 methyltransferase